MPSTFGRRPVGPKPRKSYAPKSDIASCAASRGYLYKSTISSPCPKAAPTTTPKIYASFAYLVTTRKHDKTPARGSLGAAPETKVGTMPEPPTLFDELYVPHSYLRTDPRPTEVAAARSVRIRSGTQRTRVLAAIAKAGVIGLTDDEGMTALAMGGNTYRPRRLELVEGGFIFEDGVSRMTETNHAALVWYVTSRGADALAEAGL